MRSRRLGPVLLAALVLASCGGEGPGSDDRSDDQAAAPPAETAPPAGRRPGRGGSRKLLRSNGGPRVETVATGLEAPWEIAFLPDRRALVTERPGRVRLLERGGRLRREPVARVDVARGGEAGLLGAAVDPDFRRNGFVYLYRTTDSGNEVARYRMEGNRLAEEATILDGLEAGLIHDGGRIHFGPDGLLYVSTGEAGEESLAQDRDSLNGKLLRVHDFRGGGEPEMISLGHRNVQGFDWDAQGRLFATEFGPESDDEVNRIREDHNYGWPVVQGKEVGDGYEPALVNYEDVIAPSGATFVSLPGSAWTGDFLFANLVGQQLRRLDFKKAEVRGDEPLLEGELGRLRTVVEAPDGALYVLTSNRDGRGGPRQGDDRIVRVVPPRG